MPAPDHRATLRRLRLLNFHNFTDETIELRDGGHLFMLGDNASGKTTVLDAIHLVLTGGERLELNAAARVAGVKAVGRDLSGIVTRVNLDRGAMNPEGGITYAALEIARPDGRPLSVGFAMMMRFPHDDLQYWGFIKEGPVLEVPLIDYDLNGARPLNKTELRKLVGEASFYGNREAYRRGLTERLYHEPDIFAAVCHLLAMGKAYREIVVQAADPHELFKRLLPEPEHEIFERIIAALRTLDASVERLDDLQKQLSYLEEMEQLVLGIAEARAELLRCDWLREYVTLQRLAERRQVCSERRQGLQHESAEIDRALDTLARQRMQLKAQIEDLQQRDTQGLVRQQEELRAEQQRQTAAERQQANATDAQARDTQHIERELQRRRDALCARAHALHVELQPHGA